MKSSSCFTSKRVFEKLVCKGLVHDQMGVLTSLNHEFDGYIQRPLTTAEEKWFPHLAFSSFS